MTEHFQRISIFLIFEEEILHSHKWFNVWRLRVMYFVIDYHPKESTKVFTDSNYWILTVLSKRKITAVSYDREERLSQTIISATRTSMSVKEGRTSFFTIKKWESYHCVLLKLYNRVISCNIYFMQCSLCDIMECANKNFLFDLNIGQLL